mmetsp:Transcript_4182/g.8735  ORF Transcript_4182/g.8735 Transcript_4182/m.8735 type:complete len:95 (+) Transcript_4182:111-395(+)
MTVTRFLRPAEGAPAKTKQSSLSGWQPSDDRPLRRRNNRTDTDPPIHKTTLNGGKNSVRTLGLLVVPSILHHPLSLLGIFYNDLCSKIPTPVSK